MDQLRDCPTREEVAEALSVSVHSVIQAMLPAKSASKRNAPDGWQKAIAKLARKRGAELAKLAEQLERGDGVS
jgi:hypothetical protein